jgi:hypothetical protein
MGWWATSKILNCFHLLARVSAPQMKSQSILMANKTSSFSPDQSPSICARSCRILMIRSSRARNKSATPVGDASSAAWRVLCSPQGKE